MDKGQELYDWVKQDCPVCGPETRRFVGMRGGRAHREGLGVEAKVWSCRKCNLFFPDPMPVPKNGLEQHYGVEADEWFIGHDNNSKRANAVELLKRAEAVLGRTGKLLDIGSGRGELLIAAKERGWDSHGLEGSQTFADYIERTLGIQVIRSDIESADIPTESFDMVFLAAVLEHLYDPGAVLAKVATILKPGGILYVDVPNEHGLYFKLGNAYYRLRGRDWCVNLAPTFSPYHLFGFGMRSLKLLLERHGFEPKTWTVVAGESSVPTRGGLVGKVESIGAKFATELSRYGELGTYIEMWATKKRDLPRESVKAPPN